MSELSKRDERITLHFNSEKELNDFIKALPPRSKYEIIPYEGLDRYIKISKYTYIKIERRKYVST